MYRLPAGVCSGLAFVRGQSAAERSGSDDDAFGHALADRLAGQNADVVLEREDGFIVSTGELETYLAPFRRWPAVERKAMRFVRGRVLDIGCGAGRVALHLQGRGHEVVGIDISPGAVQEQQGARREDRPADVS